VIERFVPQWLAVVVCTLLRHPQKRYAAWQDGIEVVAYTCRCGGKQRAHILPANRHIRRSLRR
jgi:hypothetical protein